MTIRFNNVYIGDSVTVVGPYEKKGPLSSYFDKRYSDLSFGCDTWEKAETKMIKNSINILLRKIKNNKIDLLVSSDLSNQLIASNYASINYNVPYIGVYSACASSVSGILVASSMIENRSIKNAIVTSSSHNNSAEKQYRNPIEYGGPKKCYTTFTTTGCGALYLTNKKSDIKVESITIGTTIDKGVTDIFNMGAVMAPAAADTLYKHLKDTNRDISYYDLILTGDLGIYGKKILTDYMNELGYDISKNYDDCGLLLYDIDKQPVYAGASGPASSALVLSSYILKEMENGKYEKVLIVPTGAIFSPTRVFQNDTIPSIAHAISLEAKF